MRHEPIKTKRVRTREDWHPSLPDGTIQISLIKLADKTFKVSAWGDDDFGMEKTFSLVPGVCIKDLAMELYRKLQDYTTKAQMKEWGMNLS
jgi:hypothetical protein